MHANGLGESWVEKFEAGIQAKDKRIAELEEENKNARSYIEELENTYACAVRKIMQEKP